MAILEETEVKTVRSTNSSFSLTREDVLSLFGMKDQEGMKTRVFVQDGKKEVELDVDTFIFGRVETIVTEVE